MPPFKVAPPDPAQGNPYLPPGPNQPFIFEAFNGINTSTTRLGVDDKQMWWCNGWFPIGPRQLRTLPGIGSVLFTASAGTSIRFFDFANIGPAPISVVYQADGSIYQVNTQTGVVTQMAPPGTLNDPDKLNVGDTQWGSQYVIIVANQPNGYWLWDGTLLYGAGTLSPQTDLTNVGLGYSSVPTVTAFGGIGTGAMFEATIAAGVVTGVVLTNPGNGYGTTDYVGLAFSGGGSTGATAILATTISNGTISSVSIVNPGAGYTSPVVAVMGGGGTGATITAHETGGIIDGATVTAAGSGFISAPTPIVSDATNPVAQANANLMPFGIQGTCVETYSGRVWIGNGATVTFSAPGSVVDFSSGSGGGNFTSNDSFLRVGYTSLIQTNGFLYLIGDSSVNYISGVQTTGSPPVTTFTNQNADPEVGTPYPNTVEVFGRNILFANSFGAHVSYGAAVTKISEALDGFYDSVTNFGGQALSAAKAIIFGKKVWMMLVPVIDPTTGDQTNILCIWNGKIWFSSVQDIDLVFVQSQEINSILTAWGTDGNVLVPLFQNPSTAFTKTVQSRLTDAPGGYQFTKASSRLWAMFDFDASSQQTINIDIDSEINSQPYSFTSPINTINVVNASGTVIPCKNATPAVIPVKSVFSGIWVLDPTQIGQQGVATGLTIETTSADISLISAMISNDIVQYRG
jgi:hypothetical protein